MTLKAYVKSLIHQRLTAISNHRAFFRMLIGEMIHQKIPQEFDVTKIIAGEMEENINTYTTTHHLMIDAKEMTRLIISLILYEVIFDQNRLYHTLTVAEQDTYVNAMLKHLN